MQLSDFKPLRRRFETASKTLLIDEMQGLLGSKNQDSERESILLSSHRKRTAVTKRVEKVGDNFVVTEYDAWCTFAFTVSGTARLSLAWNSRCLHVTMRRALAGEVKKHLALGTSPVLVECGRKFARWALDQKTLPTIDMPPHLLNRDGDNWRPLLAIAALVGSHWPDKMLAAATAGMRSAPSTDLLIALLTDAVRVIGEREEIPTKELIEAIKDIHDPSWDWSACARGREINEYFIRDTLKDVLIPAGSQRMKGSGQRDRRGYLKAQFDDAIRRYLRPEDTADDAEPNDTAHAGSTTSGNGAQQPRKPAAAKRGAKARKAGKARGKPTNHADEPPPSPEPAQPLPTGEKVKETW